MDLLTPSRPLNKKCSTELFLYCQCIIHLKITREEGITSPSSLQLFYFQSEKLAGSPIPEEHKMSSSKNQTGGPVKKIVSKIDYIIIYHA
jgi:hypothetical protein